MCAFSTVTAGRRGTVAALAALVALAVVGGAARHLIGTAVHVLVAVLEVIAWTLAGTATAAVLGRWGAGRHPDQARGARGPRPPRRGPALAGHPDHPQGYARPLPDRAARPGPG